MAGFTRYGTRQLVAATLAAGGLCAAAAVWAPAPVAAAVAVPVLAAWLGVLWFFRDPDRRIPDGPGLMVSPADGNISDITPLGQDSLLGRPGVQIGVFMNVLSVHVNRSPCDAVVETVTHRDGEYLDVRRKDAWERNESATITLSVVRDGRKLPLVLRQVAGLIARRIVTDLRTGQAIHRGERIGMIKFGSRLELLVPSELVGQIGVVVGQRVYAGSTVMVREKGDGNGTT